MDSVSVVVTENMRTWGQKDVMKKTQEEEEEEGGRNSGPGAGQRGQLSTWAEGTWGRAACGRECSPNSTPTPGALKARAE